MTRPHAIVFNEDRNSAKQSFRDECDINKIMARFQKTGILDHYTKHAPEYQDIPAIEYLDALNIVATAETMFEELPSEARKRFENSPDKFLDFVQDPENLAEMRKMGLAKPEKMAPEVSPSPQSKENNSSVSNPGKKEKAPTTSDSE